MTNLYMGKNFQKYGFKLRGEVGSVETDFGNIHTEIQLLKICEKLFKKNGGIIN